MTTFKSYLTGFVLSLLLTLVAFFPVAAHVHSKHSLFPHEYLIPFILIVALLQLVVQLVFFLHLGRESRPYWNLTAFFTTISIILILVVGSLWIMKNLNYNMTPQQMDNYMMQSENFMK